jgi:hypothetical protein
MNKPFKTLAGFMSSNSLESPRSRRSPAARRAPRRWRPTFESLEGRAMLSTLTVLNNADSGPGSLRAEIAAAQNGDTIVFAPSLNGQTIALSSGELSITKGVNIEGPGAGDLAISGNSSSRVFEVMPTVGPVTISGLSIVNGSAVRFGLDGGAILNHNYALTISDCEISGNAAVYGGGIYNTGNLSLIASTLSQNTTPAPQGDGGGIYMQTGAQAVLTNCTLASNSAAGSSSLGGGVFASYETLTKLVNCTIALNSAGSGGGIYTVNGSGVKLANDIVAENRALRYGADIDGTVYAADHNLVGNGIGENGIRNGVNGNIVGGFNGQPPINPMLGPLANNGGPTETMALLVGSQAIGHADNVAAPATDQRGITRQDVPGEATDIGAFEL